LKAGINGWTAGADSRVAEVSGGVTNIIGGKRCHEGRYLQVHCWDASVYVMKVYPRAQRCSTAVRDIVNIVDVWPFAGVARPKRTDAAHDQGCAKAKDTSCQHSTASAGRRRA